MSNEERTAPLRGILDEVCEDRPRDDDGGARAHVVAKLLEAAAGGNVLAAELRRIGRGALRHLPAMWR